MADRIPLIINPAASQIQELPSGDNLVGINQITAGGGITAVQPMALLTNVTDYVAQFSTNGVPIGFETVTHNVGCTISNSNSRITVPTAGTYLITGGIGGARDNNNTDDIQLVIKKGGSVHPSTNAFPIGSPGSSVSAGKEFTLHVSMPLVLAANDFVELAHQLLSSPGALADIGSGYFSVTKLH
tara:strand:+ start:6044 stop:6598 length:555 start_codon:yes stop_codon:yes gene_type:complete